MYKNIYRYIYQYLDASIPIVEALVLVRGKLKNKKDIQNLSSSIHIVSEGKPIYEAMVPLIQKRRGHTTISVILKSAEKTGDFKRAFRQIYEYIDSGDLIKKEIVESLTYPVLILLVSIFVSYGIVSFIFPKILPLFVSLGIELPLSTTIILFLVNYIEQNLYQIVIFFILFYYISRYMYQYVIEVKQIVDLCLLRIPGVGQFVLVYNFVYISNTILTLISSGRPLTEALHVAHEDIRLAPLREDFKLIILRQEQGVSLYQSCIESMYFTKTIWVDFLMIGERTGNIQDSIQQLNKMYIDEIISYKNMMKTWSEPLLMFFIALIVLFVALSVIKPMYSIVNHVSNV